MRNRKTPSRGNTKGSQSSGSAGSSQNEACRPDRADRGASSFAKQSTMASLYSQHDEARKFREEMARNQYFSDPPVDAALIQANLVLPGKHLLPRELQNPNALDYIRKRHGVWIVQPQPNILELHCHSMSHLKAAMADLNNAIHDMRISNQKRYVQFLTQIPVRANQDDQIIVPKGSRPFLEKLSRPFVDASSVVAELVKQLQPSFLQSTDAMMNRKESINMHVQYGRFIVKGRKKDLGDHMPFADLAGMVSQYAAIGQAKLAEFDGNLTKAHIAAEELQHLRIPEVGIFTSNEDVQQNIDIAFSVGAQELSAELTMLGYGQHTWSNVRLKRLELRPPLQWTVVAPDRKYDWQLQVDAWTAAVEIPAEMIQLLTSVTLTNPIACQPAKRQSPVLRVQRPEKARDLVDHTTVSVSTAIPFKDTPFVVQMSTVYTWQGLNVTVEPQVSYTTKLYGIHWEEALNYVPSGEVKKRWGDRQELIWPDFGSTAEDNFAEFLLYALEVLTALEDA